MLKALKAHPYLILIFSLVLVGYIFSNNRYYLSSSGQYVYKVDKWTGKTWLLSNDTYREVKRSSGKVKVATPTRTPFPLHKLELTNFKLGPATNHQNALAARIAEVTATVTNTYIVAVAPIEFRVTFYESANQDKPIHTESFYADEKILPKTTKTIHKILNLPFPYSQIEYKYFDIRIDSAYKVL